jgi:dihydrofolate synthase / folylpolyglutamate synthase
LNYTEALDWLFNIRRFGPERSLGPTYHVLDLLGDPQEKFKTIHIGGTNGKGSTSAITASILQASGLKVGLYTSPHLEDFRERIKVNDQMISVEDLTRLLNKVKTQFDKMLEYPDPMPLRFFDIVTAVCFMYFAEQGVDYGVIEVGLGGRLDATNILKPQVTVITNIGYEHVNILGPTLEDIGYEKGGIIKPDTPLVTAELKESVLDVFKARAQELGSTVINVNTKTSSEKLGVSPDGQKFNLTTRKGAYSNLVLPLFGAHQMTNAATAVTALETLNDPQITQESIRRGMSQVFWPGRLEVISKNPLIVLDCAKDAEATEAVRKTIQSDFQYEKMIAVVSMSSDKNIEGMIDNIAQVADHFIITKHSVTGRAAEPEVLIKEIMKAGKTYEVRLDQPKAFDRALELAVDGVMVLVIGSVFLAGDARAYLGPRLSPE